MEELIRRRGRSKAKLTRIITFKNQIDMATITAGEINIRIDLLKELWNDFDAIQTKIECDCLESELDAHQLEQDDFESKFCDTKAYLMQVLDQLTISDHNQVARDNTTAQPAVGPLPSSHIKLPVINLPTFDGDYSKWTSFSDLFRAVIHDNVALSPAQRLHYLKSAVKGEAARLLNTIAVTDQNYAEAWKILVDRYANKRQIITSHLKAIYSMARMNQESSKEIRRLIDVTTENVRALHALGLPTDQWDCLLVFAVTDRLDNETRHQWELTINDTEYPSFEQLKLFLERRARALEATGTDRKSSQVAKPNAVPKPQVRAMSYLSENISCTMCSAHHQLFKCERFLALPVKERLEHVKTASLCFNCLGAGHTTRSCKSSSCKKCNQTHNTLLHFEGKKKTIDKKLTNTTVSAHHGSDTKPHQVILATASLGVIDQFGTQQHVRALLDAGSQSSFITDACVQRLGLVRHKAHTEVNGLGMLGVASCRGSVELAAFSLCMNFQIDIVALIMKNITGHLPSLPVMDKEVSRIITKNKLTLADPEYHLPGRIDLLLGADSFYKLLLSGNFASGKSQLVIQNTALGWIVAGPTGKSDNHVNVHSHLLTDELNNQLKKFWEVEHLIHPKILAEEESLCEEHFKQTVSRDYSGRFVVQLPLKQNQIEIGNSRSMAEKRLIQVEKRLQREPIHQRGYSQFMEEYITLGHMELVENHNVKTSTYYLPHHFVIKEQSTTTKLRVVFDGSALPSDGVSINQALMVGPTIQEDITNIITNFRLHTCVFTADIPKMYRQVLVHPMHRDFQRILWRAAPTEIMKEYRLCTVTYGTSSAPFLAVRCLRELANIGQDSHPLAAQAIRKDFYVDDVLTGADTLEEAQLLQTQLIDLLSTGGFQLHKWTSNRPELLQQVPEHCRNSTFVLNPDDDSIKTLGILWSAGSDYFTFHITPQQLTKLSKRTILSHIARLYDPLGWVAPVVLVAKIMIQQLWLNNLGWDDDLPSDLIKYWSSYTKELPILETLQIPRKMVIGHTRENFQLHGFCDASEKAYGAAVYIRSCCETNREAHLVCSKSRLAPIMRISLPRLELCGAHLVAQLINKVRVSLRIRLDQIFMWTDSTVVLAWLTGSPHRWKTFVANRVTEILELVPAEHWCHVPSASNPADCLSRGLAAQNIINHSLWWSGPSWLQQEVNHWPKGRAKIPDDQLPEVKQTSCQQATLIAIMGNSELIKAYSSLFKLLRITAYLRRFIFNCRHSGPQRHYGWLTNVELQSELTGWIRLAQHDEFKQEVTQCSQKLPLNSSSPLLALNPFVDNEGLLRVGGRIQASNLSEVMKHPIILPSQHHLTDLIITSHHLQSLHAGPQLLSTILRTKYWIVHARRAIRRVIHRCVRCFKFKVNTSQQLMAPLPSHRVQRARPFTHCGIDYAGPITIRLTRSRGHMKTSKSYICVFICFAVRAIHIELVGDLSTGAFIAALRRFTARRGRPADIYTDCGSNFVGADKELSLLHKLISSTDYNQQVSNTLSELGINWHFNPPAAPHFGGLWEAGVRSIKYHLRRTVGLSVLTYEELYTVLTQIESALNSRPLCPISYSPDELAVLTPGHFLIGDSLSAVADPDVLNVPDNRLSRWRLMQKIFQHFWQRWSSEYLTRLQQRPKWLQVKRNLKPGDLVLIRENNIPPLKWPLARIVQSHPGTDGLVRTVTLKTAHGMYKRPITKCCLLPMQEDNLQENYEPKSSD